MAHPFVAVGTDKRGNTLECLIGIQQDDDDHRRKIPYECGQEREGENDSPYADDVYDHDELRVAAAADDAAVGGHLIGHGDQHDALDEHVGVGQRAGFVGDIVDAKQRNA